MNKVHGIHRVTRTITTMYEVTDDVGNIVASKDWAGFKTKNLRSLDGTTDEWSFAFHQVGSTIHDPVFNMKGDLESYEKHLIKEVRYRFHDGTVSNDVIISGPDLHTLIETKDVTTTFTLGGDQYNLHVWLIDSGTRFPDPEVNSATEAANGTIVETDDYFYEVNEPIFITAYTCLNGSVLKGLTVLAEIESPEGKFIEPLSDGGTNGDVRGGDGIYSLNYINTTIDGGYAIKVLVNGTVNNEPFYSEALLPNGIHVMRIGARFTGLYSDVGLDPDADSLYDLLSTKHEINVSDAGNYIISAVLKDRDGTHISTSSKITHLSVGNQIINLIFDGRQIRDSKMDGPYVLIASLCDGNYNQLDEKELNTSPYNYTDFQKKDAEFTSNYSDYGIDNNADGLYDFLVIEAEVNASVAGSYSVMGKLYDEDGNEIAWNYNDNELDAGIHSIPLNFDGLTIFKHEANGPYSLSVSLFDEDGTKIVYQENAHKTASYNYMKFQKPLVQFAGKYNDYGIDEDSDGLYDYLVVEAEVNAGESGNYRSAAWLYGNETVIAKISNISYPGEGVQKIDLEFSGLSISQKGINGPYTLIYLALYDDTGNIVNYGWNIYNTSAYSYMEFEGAGLPGDVDSDYKVDIFDLALLCSHWLEQDCGYPNWCEGTDLDHRGSVQFMDYAVFAEHWLKDASP